MKKIIVVFLVFIFLLSSSCNSGECDDLSSWVGVYTFEEIYDRYYDANDEMNAYYVHYEITIYEDNSDYFADIVIDLPIPLIRNLQAKLIGDEEWISLIFLSGDQLSTAAHADMVLVSFRKESKDIYTYWGGLSPCSDENEQSNKIYFEKVY